MQHALLLLLRQQLSEFLPKLQVVSLVGAWGACGGPGERRGDGVRVGSAYAKTTSKKPHQATKSKAQADFCGFRSTRAAIESVSCHSRIRRDEIWVSYHHEAQFRMSVSRTTLLKPRSDFCAERPAVMQGSLRALRPRTRPQRAVRLKSHPKQEILASNNLKGKRRTISTSLVSENPLAKCAADT